MTVFAVAELLKEISALAVPVDELASTTALLMLALTNGPPDIESAGNADPNCPMAVMPEAAARALEESTFAAVGAALNAVIPALVDPVKAEAPVSAVEVPDMATRTEADPEAVSADAPVRAVEVPEMATRTDPEPEALRPDIPVRATEVPLAVSRAAAVAGAPLKAVIAAEAEELNAEIDASTELPRPDPARTWVVPGHEVKKDIEIVAGSAPNAVKEAAVVATLVTKLVVLEEAALAP